MKNFLIITKEGRAGRITLARSDALHALNQHMCGRIIQALLRWIDDDQVEFVFVDHIDGSRGFCVGGDVEMLARSGRCDAYAARKFFETEYRMNDLISRYPKPFISVLDGITMGGGVGLSVHGSHQVATERTVLAMPETGIGLFPDVGSTWFLPRLPGELGTWLALTGARLKGTDVVAAGFATHYCPSDKVNELKGALARKGPSALTDYEIFPPISFREHMSEMNSLFSGCCAMSIMTALNRGSKWAKAQATKISAKSPLSTKIALRQIRTGMCLSSLQAALRLEYRIASRLVRFRDFHEGVRAVVLDKDHAPRWQPNDLRCVHSDLVSSFFSPLEDHELSFLEI